MKTYITTNNTIDYISSDDIKVGDIYGIYQKLSKALYETKYINKKSNIIEVDLLSNKITNTYKSFNDNTYIDQNNNKIKISNDTSINVKF